MTLEIVNNGLAFGEAALHCLAGFLAIAPIILVMIRKRSRQRLKTL